MVYSCGVREPFEYAVNRELIGAKEEDFYGVRFLHPEAVDELAKQPKKIKTVMGYPIIPADMPKKLLWGDKRKTVPDFILYRSTPIVTAKVKAIIERFEPNAHQFVPIDLYHRNAETSFATHYWLIIGKLVDTIDANQSGYELVMSTWAKGVGHYKKTNEDTSFIYDSFKIKDHHLWRERYSQRWWMASDQLVAALDEGRATGLGRHHKGEVG